MKVIGLTGGIGSGKSTLLKWFQAQGVPCFESDVAGRVLLDSTLREEVSKRFGSSLYGSDGRLDRAALAALVFNDTTALDDLNKLVHPAVASAFKTFKKQHDKAPFVINEAAILFETGGYKKCDLTILVKAPMKERIQRIISRNGVSEEEVLARMKQQWSDEKKEQYADFVILNTDLEKTYEQAVNVLKKLRE